MHEEALSLKKSINAWLNNGASRDASVAFDKLIDTWGASEVVSRLACLKWENFCEIPERLKGSKAIEYCPRKKKAKTIAFFYWRISNGGAERVVVDLCNRFAGKKDADGHATYNVVCITDETLSGDAGKEYPLSPRVKRAFLHSLKDSKKDFHPRCEAWKKIFSLYEIDIVVSGNWTDPGTFWDCLCVKTCAKHVAFVVHSHGYNAGLYLRNEQNPRRIAALYRLCDGVVALSACDVRLIEKSNSHVRAIQNPLPFDLPTTDERQQEKNTIVWVGRISGEKRPLDAVRMMKMVVQKIPDAKLYLVGTGRDDVLAEVKRLASTLGIESNIELTGFTIHPEKFYAKATLCVSTTEFEGLALVFGEAMAFGVPVLCYDMPWLTFVRDGRGIKTVERLCPDALANEVVRLLSDPEKAKAMGALGREHIVEMMSVDIVSEWQNFFLEIENGVPAETEFSKEESAQLDAINERCITMFRTMRKRRALPRILIRLGAMFILNKSARKRWRERRFELLP